MFKSVSKKLTWAFYLLILGILIIGICFAATGFNFDKFNNELNYEEKSLTESLTDIDNIVIDTENQDVIVLASSDDTLQLAYFENESIYYTFNKTDSTYNVKISDSRKWYQKIFTLDIKANKIITVKVPVSFVGDINIVGSNTEITVSDFDFENINITTSNGNINLSDISTSKITAKTSNNDITLSNIITTDATVLETDNGDIILSNSTFASIKGTTSNDDIRLDNLTSDNIELNTSNAKIKGTITGTMSDYKITSSTSTDKRNSLPPSKTDGTKTLIAHTSNDDIEITFVN